MSTATAHMLISPVSGGNGQQTSGTASAPSAANGIFAALLGNQAGQPGIADLSENAMMALVNNAPTSIETPGALSTETLTSLASGIIPGDTISVSTSSANTPASDLPGTIANIMDPASGKAASGTTTAALATSLKAPATEDANIALQQGIVASGKETLDQQSKHAAGASGKETLDQQSKHAAGAQAPVAVTASGLRPTSLTREDEPKITSQFGDRKSSPSPSQSGASLMANPGAGATKASTHALVHSNIVTAFGAQGIERPDPIAANSNHINNLTLVRETAATENYTQQMRLAGDGVKAPARSLAVEISNHAQAGIKRFEIRMDPPELGRIDVRLEMKDNGSVTTRLVVERAETLELLQRDTKLIERTLSDNGLKTDEGGIRMSLKNDGNGEQSQTGANEPEDQNSQSNNAVAPDTTILMMNEDYDGLPLSHRAMADGRLDISV